MRPWGLWTLPLLSKPLSSPDLRTWKPPEILQPTKLMQSRTNDLKRCGAKQPSEKRTKGLQPTLPCTGLLRRQRGLHPAKMMRALSSREHNDDFDRSGDRPSPFARLIRNAEDFDDLIRSEGKGSSPVTQFRG